MIKDQDISRNDDLSIGIVSTYNMQLVLPHEAVSQLSPFYKGDSNAKDVIISRIYDGTLDLFSECMIEEADLGPPPSPRDHGLMLELQSHPGQIYESFQLMAGFGEKEILRAEYFFPKFDGWKIDLDHCDWKTGFFLARASSSISSAFENLSLTTRRVASGVSFRRDQIEAIIAPKGSSNAGRKPKDAEWVAFWHAVIELSQEGKLNLSCFPSAEALKKEILFTIHDALGDGTVDPIVRQLYKKFVKSNN